MKRLYFFPFFFLFCIVLKAQHKESQNIIEKLWHDDKMLNVMLDTRMDFQTGINKDDVEEISFRAHTIKLWLVGEVVPGIRYRLRHRLNRNATLQRDNYSNATDHAWVAFDAGKRWTITAGRQSIQFGTYEYDYNGADVYLSTMVNNDIDLYKTGVNAAYRFSGQTINLQIVNSDASQYASEEYKKKALAMAFLWQGDLFDGVLKTRWGYAGFQHTKTKIYHWMTLGTQLNIGKFAAELDYFLGRRNMDYGSIVNDDELGLRYVSDQSLALNLKYDWGKWHSSIKGVWNQRHDLDMDKDAYQIPGIQAAVEWYPFTNPLTRDLRFHAMYSYTTTDYKGNFSQLEDLQQHMVLAGMRWLFKAK